eukprot:5736655-Pyramimonas_sp.AAC.1
MPANDPSSSLLSNSRAPRSAFGRGSDGPAPEPTAPPTSTCLNVSLNRCSSLNALRVGLEEVVQLLVALDAH